MRRNANSNDESGDDPRSMDDDIVVHGVLTAIGQKRLAPGTKLGEDRLARASGTSRIHVRQALAHLASRHIVVQFPNRGTFVHRPSWKEAQDIFAARRVVEAATTGMAIDRLDARGEALIREHVAREAAHDPTDRPASLALTADFHILIARLADNSVLFDAVKELTLRTSLAIATFETPGSLDCSPRAHPDIAGLILRRDKAAALAEMNHHIDEIEARLIPLRAKMDDDELTAIFKEIGSAAASGART